MPNLKFKQRMPYSPGRTKGSANVLTRSIREGLLATWHRVQGVEGMVEWVERNDDNRTAFYGFLTKLLPHELAESGLSGHLTIVVQRGAGQQDSKSIPLEIHSSACLQGDEAGGLSADGGACLGNPSGTDRPVVSTDEAWSDTEEG